MNFSGVKLNKYFETFEFFYLEFIFENLEKEIRFPNGGVGVVSNLVVANFFCQK